MGRRRQQYRGQRQQLLGLAMAIASLFAFQKMAPAQEVRPAQPAVSPSATESVPPTSWWKKQPKLKFVPPERRPEFWRNWQTWHQMTSEERRAMRKDIVRFRHYIHKEAENALARSGLTLDDENKRWFILRYIQERRNLERDLKKQMRAERDRRLPQIEKDLTKEFWELQNLQKEFGSSAAPLPSPMPTATPVPFTSPVAPAKGAFSPATGTSSATPADRPSFSHR